jgi:acyl-CoA synthetase (AMP-forming)/AMP-acid ligase II/peptidoglycan/LPS O-acetylase OafA/YrhL
MRELQATAIVRKNSLAFVEATFALYSELRPFVLVADADQADRLPGLKIDRCIDPAESTGWFSASHPVILDDRPAQVSYTSGTEGQPKGILLSYRNLGYTTERIIDVMQMTAEIREYVGVPATFSFGMARYRAVSAVGGRAYLPPRGFDPLELARMLAAGEVNALSAVPTLLRVLLADPALIGPAGKALRWMEIGSQQMTADEKRRIREMFPNALIVQHYGLTEASRSTFLTISGAPDHLLASVGHPVGDGEIQISPDGRIRIRGPQVARSRIDADGLHDLTDGDGWLQTNDLGHIQDGYLFFDGRADDLINCGGQKVVPDQLEERMRARIKSGVQIAVAKVPDPQRGEGILVAVAGQSVPLDAIRSAAAAALQDMGISPGNALHVMALDALPVTGTGKVQRRKLAELFADRQPDASAPVAASEDDIHDVLSLFRHEFPGQDVQPDDSFETLGGDSLHYIHFSLSFERHFGALPDGWERLTTVELQSRISQSAPTTWRGLETVTLTRAFFMICIIGLHAEAFTYSSNWGAAYFLYILAGYSVARFQLPEIIRSGSVRTLWGTVISLAVPTILMDAFLELTSWNFELPSLLLISNYQDPTTITGTTFYFIEIFIQMMLIAIVMLSVPQVRAAFQRNPLASSLAYFAVIVAVDMVIEANWDGDFNYHRTPWHYGWCFALGMVIASAKDLRAQILVFVLCATWVPYYFGLTSAAAYVTAASALVIFVRAVPVPAQVKTLVSEIAGTSMFIYLTHYPAMALVGKAFRKEMPWISFFVAILAGIAASRVYFWLERKVLQLARIRTQTLRDEALPN